MGRTGRRGVPRRAAELDQPPAGQPPPPDALPRRRPRPPGAAVHRRRPGRALRRHARGGRADAGARRRAGRVCLDRPQRRAARVHPHRRARPRGGRRGDRFVPHRTAAARAVPRRPAGVGDGRPAGGAARRRAGAGGCTPRGWRRRWASTCCAANSRPFTDGTDGKGAGGRLSAAQVSRVVDWVNGHLAGAVPLGAMADAAGASRGSTSPAASAAPPARRRTASSFAAGWRSPRS